MERIQCLICKEILTDPAEGHSENLIGGATPRCNLIPGSTPHRITFSERKSVRGPSCTPCGHLHTKCLQNWMLSNRTCPNCGKDIPAVKINQVAGDSGQIFHPPPDLTAGLRDNIAKLRAELITLIADYKMLKQKYLSDRDQINFLSDQVVEIKADIRSMKTECEALKKAQSVRVQDHASNMTPNSLRSNSTPTSSTTTLILDLPDPSDNLFPDDEFDQELSIYAEEIEENWRKSANRRSHHQFSNQHGTANNTVASSSSTTVRNNVTKLSQPSVPRKHSNMNTTHDNKTVTSKQKVKRKMTDRDYGKHQCPDCPLTFKNMVRLGTHIENCHEWLSGDSKSAQDFQTENKNIFKMTPSWFCPFKIQADLIGNFHPVVFLVGLDVNVHRGIWESLNLQNLTKSFKPVYKVVPIGYSFSAKKPKNEPIECYMPHGIIKSNWSTKHLNEIPSVVIIFFDLNWTPSQWHEKKTEIAQHIKSIKTVVYPHGTQILVMLIKTAGVGEDFTSEKASALCAAAEILPKHLFVLPQVHLDRIQTCLQRLEYETELYYKVRIKRVSTYKEKATQTPLIVRYNFKIGFFHEIRSDYEAALSHYHAANDALLNIKMTEANVQELKVVAAILNYRICRLYLLTANIKESKAQFDKHIRSFYKLEGNPDLLFEHLAWLQQQYHIYGELLKHHYRYGTNFPDPVAYFVWAARYAERRKKFFHEKIELLGKLTWPPEMASFEGELELQFLGQRPWRIDSFSLENVYEVEDARAVSMLTYLESITNHSMTVINHLGVASDFCKDTKRNRTRCQLMNSMGVEFLAAKDYSNCVMLMKHVIREMSYKKWNKIILSVAECGLRAACCEGDIPSYLNFLIILLKTDSLEMDKVAIRNLWSKFEAVMDGRMPIIEEGCEIKLDNWQNSLNKPFTAYVECHDSCILHFNVYFLNETVHYRQPADIRFELTNRSEFKISVRKYGIRIMNIEKDIEAVVELTLQPGESRELDLQINPLPKDVGKYIQMQVAFVDIGKENRSVILHNSLLISANTSTWVEDSLKEKMRLRKLSVKVESPKPKLEVQMKREGPVLVNEWYRIVVTWDHKDDIDCNKLLCSYILTAADVHRVVLTVDPEKKNFPGHHTHMTKVEKIAARNTLEVVLYVKTLNPAETEMKITIEGKYLDSYNETMIVKHEESVEVLGPFDVSQYTTNLLAEKIDYISPGEEFCLSFQIQNVSKTALNLIDGTLNVKSSQFKLKPVEQKQICNTTLVDGEKVEFVCIMDWNTTSEIDPASLGHLELTWERSICDSTLDRFITKTEVPVIPLVNRFSPLYLRAVFSNNGRGKLKVPMLCSYVILNRSASVYDLTISMESTESFMNGGPKKVTLKLKSKEEAEFSYILFPLATGCIPVPTLNIESTTSQEGDVKMPLVLDTQDVPKTIFVTP